MAVPTTSQPSASPDWCYISSGTWSLMGVEVPRPVINQRCLELNFTNEGGVDNTVRLLKNIAGLWIVQECRRIWSLQGRDYSWDDLTQAAAEAPPLAALIDPDDVSFTAPREMPAAIAAYCQRTGQQVPTSDGAFIRCALESLTLRYRAVLQALEELTRGRIETIHIVGGGTRNKQLCQMTADACNRRVVAGPVEATALGNAMMQAITAGQVQSISAAREIIGQSFAVEEYEPRASTPWDEAFERFQRLRPQS
jgi:rhamnulokinase